MINPEDIKNPEIEKVELPTTINPTNEGTGNKNYHFHNCTITINEEGKAIDVLAAKQKAEADKQAKQMEISSVLVTEITKVFSKAADSLINPKPTRSGHKPTPAPEMPDFKAPKKAAKKATAKAAPKKATVKKVAAKKSARKK